MNCISTSYKRTSKLKLYGSNDLQEK